MALFWAQIAVFVIILGTMLLPFLRTFVRFAFLPLMSVCFIVGLVSLILSVRTKPTDALKRFLTLTGASSTGFVVSSVLHNVFYGLATLTGDRSIVRYTMKGLEVTFFIIAVFVCPVCFIVGTVGVIVILLRSDRRDDTK